MLIIIEPLNVKEKPKYTKKWAKSVHLNVLGLSIVTSEKRNDLCEKLNSYIFIYFNFNIRTK
jgi:hypothetical protein